MRYFYRLTSFFLFLLLISLLILAEWNTALLSFWLERTFPLTVQVWFHSGNLLNDADFKNIDIELPAWMHTHIHVDHIESHMSWREHDRWYPKLILNLENITTTVGEHTRWHWQVMHLEAEDLLKHTKIRFMPQGADNHRTIQWYLEGYQQHWSLYRYHPQQGRLPGTLDVKRSFDPMPAWHIHFDHIQWLPFMQLLNAHLHVLASSAARDSKSESIQAHAVGHYGKQPLEFTYRISRTLKTQQWEGHMGVARGLIKREYSPHPHIEWSVQIPKLSEFYSLWGGQLNSQGKAEWDLQKNKLNLSTQGNANGLRHPWIDTQTLIWNAHIDNQKTILVDLQAQDIQLPSWHIHYAHAHMAGPAQAHELSLDLREDTVSLFTQWTGSLDGLHWNGQSQQTRLDLPGHRLNSEAPLQASWDEHRFELNPFCLSQKHTRLCGEASWIADQGWRARWNTENLRSDFLNHGKEWLPVSLEHALINSQSEYTERSTAPQLTSHIQLSSGWLQPQASSLSVVPPIPFQNISIDIAWNDRAGLSARLEGLLSAHNRVHSEWVFPKTPLSQPQFQQVPLTGNVVLDAAQLNEMTPYASGTLHSQINLHSDGRSTHLTTRGDWKDGSLRLPSLPWNAQHLHAHWQNDTTHNDHLMLEATGLLNQGRWQLKGEGFYNTRQWKLHSSAQDSELIHTPEYQLWGNHELDLNNSPRGPLLSGTLDVTRGSIRSNFMTEQSTLEDLVDPHHPKTEKTSPDLPLLTHIDVQVHPEVSLEILGVKGQLSGQLHIEDEPHAPMRGKGELRLSKAQYQGYGQTMEIKHGSVFFRGGSITNPYLELIATRPIRYQSNTQDMAFKNKPSDANNHIPWTDPSSQIVLPGLNEEVRVGFRLQGPINSPDFRLYSEPILMSQGDILSYLVAGRPLNQLTSADGLFLLQAVPGLNLGGNQLAQINRQILHTFAFDDVHIEHQNNNANDATASNLPLGVGYNPSLVLRKNISNKLTIDYSIGLIAPSNLLRLRYELNRRWHLQGEMGAQSSGVDLYYSVER